MHELYKSKKVLMKIYWEWPIKGNVLPIPWTRAVWIIMGSNTFYGTGRKGVKDIPGIACNSQKLYIYIKKLYVDASVQSSDTVFITAIRVIISVWPA